MKIQKCQKCPLCKAEMKPSKTSLPYETGDDSIIVIKDVPAIVCSQCGEFLLKFRLSELSNRLRLLQKKTVSDWDSFNIKKLHKGMTLSTVLTPLSKFC